MNEPRTWRTPLAAPFREPQRSRTLIALLIVVQAIGMGYFTESWTFPAMAILLTVAAAASTTRFDLDARKRFALGVALSLLFIGKHLVAPVEFPKGMQYIGSQLAYAIAQFLIAVQASQLMLRRPDPLTLTAIPALGGVALVCVGDVLVTRPERQAFQLLVATFVVLSVAYYVASRRLAEQASRRRSTARNAVVLLALATILGLSWTSANALQRNERKIERFIAQFLAGSTRNRGSSAGYSDEAYLDSILSLRTMNEHAIALRVRSDEPPGYVRGKAFDVYTPGDREWVVTAQARTIGPESQVPETLSEATTRGRLFSADLGRLPLEAFSFQADEEEPEDPAKPKLRVRRPRNLPPFPGHPATKGTLTELRSDDPHLPRPAAVAAAAWRTYEFQPSSTLSGIVFTPHGASHVAVDVAEVNVDRHGTFRAPLLPPERSFVACVPVKPLSPPPTEDEWNIYLELHPDIDNDARIQSLTQEVTAGCVTHAEKIAAVVAHFQRNYEYRLGISVPKSQEPLAWFLLKRPPAHCEYFASGATVLLRMAGVPCRFVTGFVVTERNDIGDYWVARNRNAHAWVEAWDGERGWTIVEATPASGVPQPEDVPKVSQLTDYLQNWLQRIRVAVADATMESVGAGVLDFVRSPIGAVTFAVGASLWLLRRRFRRRSSLRPSPRDPLLEELHALLARMDSRLRRRQFDRRPSETLQQFATRLRSAPASASAADALLRDAADWYDRYSQGRYSGELAPALVAELRTRLPEKVESRE